MIRQADAARNLPRVIVLSMHNGSMKNYNYLVVDPSGLRAVIVDPAWEADVTTAEREYLSAVLQSRVLRGFSLEKEAGHGKAFQFLLRACARGKKYTIRGKS